MRPACTSMTIETGSSSMTRRAPSVRRTCTPRAPSPTQAALPAAISASVAAGTQSGSASDERGGQPEHDREQAGAERAAHYNAGVAATASATTRSPVVS